MKPASMFAALIVSSASLALSACGHSSAHHGTTPNDAAPAAKGAMSHGSKMDRTTMCSIYAKMTPEEKQAMMEAHHGKVSPEMMQRHNKMMQEKCVTTAPQR
jgi:hypothetical protein